MKIPKEIVLEILKDLENSIKTLVVNPLEKEKGNLNWMEEIPNITELCRMDIEDNKNTYPYSFEEWKFIINKLFYQL